MHKICQQCLAQECLAFDREISVVAIMVTKSHAQDGNCQRIKAIDLKVLRIPSFHED
jgi:hypothetical protein